MTWKKKFLNSLSSNHKLHVLGLSKAERVEVERHTSRITGWSFTCYYGDKEIRSKCWGSTEGKQSYPEAEERLTNTNWSLNKKKIWKSRTCMKLFVAILENRNSEKLENLWGFQFTSSFHGDENSIHLCSGTVRIFKRLITVLNAKKQNKQQQKAKTKNEKRHSANINYHFHILIIHYIQYRWLLQFVDYTRL